MKRFLLAMVFIGLWAGHVHGQADVIGAYADVSGSSCNIVDNTPQLIDVHVVHARSPGTMGSQFSAPTPGCFTAFYTGETVNPAFLSIGDARNGILVSYGGMCQSAPVWVMTIQYFGFATTPSCCYYPILPDPAHPSGELVTLDCSVAEIPAFGASNTINGDGGCPCLINTTITVPNDYSTIQGAINAAITGDTVEVAAGTYTGADNKNLDFGGKQLVLRSQSGPESTIIDCEGSGRGLIFQNGETSACVFDGFTITNGNTGASAGGGIWVGSGSPIIRNCIITGNTTTFTGGGIRVKNSASPTIENCTISLNSAQSGGGIQMSDSTAPAIQGCTISANTATSNGGGIRVSGSSLPSIDNNVIKGNLASNGGGLSLDVARVVTIENNTIAGNHATSDGGGIHHTGPILLAQKQIIWGNCADGIADETFIATSDSVAFDCCDVDSSGVDGGGPFVTFYISSTIFTAPVFCDPQPCSSAPTTGGDYGLAANSPCNGGLNPCGSLIGALGTECDSRPLTVGVDSFVVYDYPTIQGAIDGALASDTVEVSSGIYTGAENKNLDYGGKDLIVRSESGAEVTIIDCEDSGRGLIFQNGETSACVFDGFTITNGNTGASAGAGVWVTNGDPVIRDCIITQNTTIYVGGGIATMNTVSPTIQNCTINGNTASSGAGIQVYGSSSPLIQGCRISGNTATNNGGGIMSFGAAAPTMDSNVITGNLAADGGGMSMETSQFVTMTNSTISGNRATNQGGGIHQASSGVLWVEESIVWGNCSAVSGDEAYIEAGDSLMFVCCDVDSSGVDGGASHEVFYQTSTIHVSPLFCSRQPCTAAPTAAGGYGLPSNSRCNSGLNSCGLLMGALGAECGNKPVTVGAGPAYDYATIQAAIDASLTGDTVLVANGIYTGVGNRDLDFGGKEIVLISENGADSTIIDCEGLGRGFVFENFEDTAAVVDGFTIRNGSAVDGGGILIDFAKPTITNCTITRNAASSRGGGIIIDGSDSYAPKIAYCTITENTANFGGGIYVDNTSPKILHCTVQMDTASSSGGGLYISFSDSAIVFDCTITNNVANGATTGDGGGINLNGGAATIESCDIIGNFADDSGGGIKTWQGYAGLITGCTVSTNTAFNSNGGGFDITSSPTITGCTITGNVGSSGGGLYMNFSPVITNCTISDNTATSQGGGFKINNGNPTISNCTVSGNTANSGGGIQTDQGSGTVADCTITGNFATFNGGGLYSSNSASYTGCTFAGNHAARGGGIRVESLISLDRSIVWGNCADVGGEEVWVSAGDSISFSCCAIDSAGFENQGTVFYVANNVFTDPLFCDQASCAIAPSTGGEYTLDDDSPCLPEASLCSELIGSKGQGCTARVVDVGGDGEYDRIQDGIDAAVVGDTVVVADSTWTGTRNTALDFDGKNIVLKSAGGPSAAIISCGDSVRGIVFESGEDNTSIVDGFTITRTNPTLAGSAILVDSMSSPVIRNCVISDNASAGGVIRVESGSPTFEFCVIQDDTATSADGVLALVGGTPTIDACVIQNNAGATAVSIATAVRFENCAIANNDTVGMHFVSAPPCTVVGGNVSGNGGRGIVLYNTSVALDGVDIVGNVGGGIVVTGLSGSVPAGSGQKAPATGSDVYDMTNCNVVGNSADFGAALLFRCQDQPGQPYTPTFTDCRFSGNHATFDGGAVLICGSAEDALIQPMFLRCTITANSAQRGGGIFMDVASGGPGTASAIFEQTILWGNCSTEDPQGEAFVESDNVLDFDCSHIEFEEMAGTGTIDTFMVTTGVPEFCDFPRSYYSSQCEGDTTTRGDFALSTTSPAAPANHPCQIQIGASVVIPCVPTPIRDDAPRTPTATALRPCMPNPFNPTTTIVFDLARRSHVTLRIYDVAGRLVRTLADEALPAARHRVVWDGVDNRGNHVASGVYFLRFTGGDIVKTQKMVLIK